MNGTDKYLLAVIIHIDRVATGNKSLREAASSGQAVLHKASETLGMSRLDGWLRKESGIHYSAAVKAKDYLLENGPTMLLFAGWP